jgi:hypothetical protein
MTMKEFFALHQACDKSLERLHKESQQTLACLLLAAQAPSDETLQAGLRTQRDEEDRARLDYQQRRRELFALLNEQ